MLNSCNVLRVSLFAGVVLILSSCTNGTKYLDKIKAKGELVVLTRNAACSGQELSSVLPLQTKKIYYKNL